MSSRRPRPATPATDAAPAVAYTHPSQTRKNIPPAGLAAQGRVREVPKHAYSYDPHLPPALRSDPTGGEDALPDLIAAAMTRPLTAEEARTLAAGLRQRQPWLEWSTKRETPRCVVDPIALQVHERVSAQAVIRAAQREGTQRDLFADPQQPYREALQFYQHDVGWANRLILGDSLQVMASLARREDLAGKVQMIYLDPPYGIKFASNFQSEVGRRDVKDKEQDLTREPEMIKAYRDTWTLGVHSYLAYLRDRLLLAKELLADSGSIFVQISDENLHRVRCVMDEVFGAENFQALVVYRTSVPLRSTGLASIGDFLLWYAKDTGRMKRYDLFTDREIGEGGIYTTVEEPSGHRRSMTAEEREDPNTVDGESRVFGTDNLVSSGYTPTCIYNVTFEGAPYSPKSGKSWKTNADGMKRLIKARRVNASGKTLRAMMYVDDYPVFKLTTVWNDTKGESEKEYVVQTATKVVQRCLLMTTDPGDLVFDPTCGSGTTAVVAEQWGRRWVTTDTSRVAVSIARQRVLTSKFDQYRVNCPTPNNGHTRPAGDPANGFVYKTVPHVTLRSIAQNAGLDGIFARHQTVLDAALAKLNTALAGVTPALRTKLKSRLAEKEKREGKRAVTDADRRRWLIPNAEWREWEVPFDAEEEWPAALRDALVAYRAAWRAKMDEVNAVIAANAEAEPLVDQPEVVPGVVRVSGPFTVEGVMPAALSLDDAGESPIEGLDGDLDTFIVPGDPAGDATNAEAYLDRMLRYLRQDGVRFPDNKVAAFARLDPLGGSAWLHAEGEWDAGGAAVDGGARRVAVSVGPEHGPVTGVQVAEALHVASRRGYDDLVFAGFSFDDAAQTTLQDDPNPRVRAHLAYIRPDVQMGGLLKETPSAQLFTVFGAPRTELRAAADGTYTVEMQGVDVYDPVQNVLQPTRADKVAAWFLDADYDGKTFCVSQAFFPDRSAWDKLARALKGRVDDAAWDAFAGTVSLPFPVGVERRVAVKVIDPRGNEVMRVHRLPAASDAAGAPA